MRTWTVTAHAVYEDSHESTCIVTDFTHVDDVGLDGNDNGLWSDHGLRGKRQRRQFDGGIDRESSGHDPLALVRA